MSDPRQLNDAMLFYFRNEHEGRHDPAYRQLLDHITWQAERLAYAEELLMDVLTDVDDDFDGFSSVRMDVVDYFGKDPKPWD